MVKNFAEKYLNNDNDINVFELTDDELNQITNAFKYQLNKTIINQLPDKEKKKEFIDSIMNQSIKVAETTQDFEICYLLLQLKNRLNEE